MEKRIEELQEELVNVTMQMQELFVEYQQYSTNYNEQFQAMRDKQVGLTARIEELSTLITPKEVEETK